MGNQIERRATWAVEYSLWTKMKWKHQQQQPNNKNSNKDDIVRSTDAFTSIYVFKILFFSCFTSILLIGQNEYFFKMRETEREREETNWLQKQAVWPNRNEDETHMCILHIILYPVSISTIIGNSKRRCKKKNGISSDWRNGFGDFVFLFFFCGIFVFGTLFHYFTLLRIHYCILCAMNEMKKECGEADGHTIFIISGWKKDKNKNCTMQTNYSKRVHAFTREETLHTM